MISGLLAAITICNEGLNALHAVGNIPYDVTEDMLIEVFKTAGPIKAMR